MAVTIDIPEEARTLQRRFENVTLYSDTERTLVQSLDIVRQDDFAPGGAESVIPTTLLVDADGTIKWIYRPQSIVRRLGVDELLAAADESL